jgi:hypothetical protein
MKTRFVWTVLAAVLFAGSATALTAQGFPTHCSGTYLIAENGGARDFWTLQADGTFFGTTSTQPLFNFSNQQGTWKRVPGEGAHGVLFAFVWNSDGSLLTTARIDISLHTVGEGCGQIAGSLEVRTFEDGEDPLDPSTDTGDPIATDTFTGRRAPGGA